MSFDPVKIVVAPELKQFKFNGIETAGFICKIIKKENRGEIVSINVNFSIMMNCPTDRETDGRELCLKDRVKILNLKKIRFKGRAPIKYTHGETNLRIDFESVSIHFPLRWALESINGKERKSGRICVIILKFPMRKAKRDNCEIVHEDLEKKQFRVKREDRIKINIPKKSEISTHSCRLLQLERLQNPVRYPVELGLDDRYGRVIPCCYTSMPHFINFSGWRTGNVFEIEDLIEIPVKNADEALDVLAKGTSARKGMTKFAKKLRSPRAHLLYTFTLEVREKDVPIQVSKMHFVEIGTVERVSVPVTNRRKSWMVAYQYQFSPCFKDSTVPLYSFSYEKYYLVSRKKLGVRVHGRGVAYVVDYGLERYVLQKTSLSLRALVAVDKAVETRLFLRILLAPASNLYPGLGTSWELFVI
ncbi:hypothetical protein TNCV_2964591 [Trichonephila clavipes]|nr:hypothetical protein TNCV_2964591 [Trichonephila clavipes]